MKRLKRSYIFIFVILFVALACIIYLVPELTGALRSTYVLEFGELSVADEGDGYFVRNEKVYFSAKDGLANRYIAEGKLVRKGTHVMDVEGNLTQDDARRAYNDIIKGVGKAGITTDSYETQAEGLVTFNADGREAEFTPKTMYDKSYGDYRSFDNDDNMSLVREEVRTGEPVFKVVDRSAWYIVCFVPKEHRKRYEAEGRLTIRLDDRKTMYGNVMDLKEDGSRVRMIIRTNYYYKGFEKQRVASVKLTTSDAMGLLIKNSSITRRKGHEGVLVKQKNGKYKFVRINVIATDGDQSVVSRMYFLDENGETIPTVQNYDEVLKRA
jgi:putative membrane fusion protein